MQTAVSVVSRSGINTFSYTIFVIGICEVFGIIQSQTFVNVVLSSAREQPYEVRACQVPASACSSGAQYVDIKIPLCL